MQSGRSFIIALVTAPDIKTARKLARTVLQDHLAACVNLIPGIESHYWWQGQIERGTEVLLVIKTTQARLPALEKQILARHPYDTCEILALPVASGTRRYLAWLKASVA